MNVAGVHQLAYTERNKRKDRPRSACRHRAEHETTEQSAGCTDQRHQHHRQRQALVDRAHDVNGRIAAKAEIDSVTERQQARLSEEQVERQREHRRDRHLRQQRSPVIGVEARQVRQHNQQRDGENEPPPAAPNRATAGGGPAAAAASVK
jgi:hypothetical protein